MTLSRLSDRILATTAGIRLRRKRKLPGQNARWKVIQWEPLGGAGGVWMLAGHSDEVRAVVSAGRCPAPGAAWEEVCQKDLFWNTTCLWQNTCKAFYSSCDTGSPATFQKLICLKVRDTKDFCIFFLWYLPFVAAIYMDGAAALQEPEQGSLSSCLGKPHWTLFYLEFILIYSDWMSSLQSLGEKV